jgi:hypothetical protein
LAKSWPLPVCQIGAELPKRQEILVASDNPSRTIQTQVGEKTSLLFMILAYWMLNLEGKEGKSVTVGIVF